MQISKKDLSGINFLQNHQTKLANALYIFYLVYDCFIFEVQFQFLVQTKHTMNLEDSHLLEMV